MPRSARWSRRSSSTSRTRWLPNAASPLSMRRMVGAGLCIVVERMGDEAPQTAQCFGRSPVEAQGGPDGVVDREAPYELCDVGEIDRMRAIEAVGGYRHFAGAQ